MGTTSTSEQVLKQVGRDQIRSETEGMVHHVEYHMGQGGQMLQGTTWSAPPPTLLCHLFCCFHFLLFFWLLPSQRPSEVFSVKL